MKIKQNGKPINKQRLVILLFLMIAASACNLPNNGIEQPNTVEQDLSEKQIETPPIVDTNLLKYRLYFDSSPTEDENTLQIRRFEGVLSIANLEEIFGDLDDLPLDDKGNKLGGPILAEGLFWTLVASPSLDTTKLVTQGGDGMINSAFDLNGDGTADIVDIRIADGRRFSFVTEDLGMAVFEQMLQGIGPGCGNYANISLELGEGFGCSDSENDDNAGAVGPQSRGGLINPWDLMCQGYETAGSAVVLSQGGTHTDGGEVLRKDYSRETNIIEETRTFIKDTHTLIFENLNGDHTQTVRVITESELLVSGEEPTGENTRILLQIVEIVTPDGNGSRTTTDATNGRIFTYSFTANLDEDGDYSSDETTPAATTYDYERAQETDDEETTSDTEEIDAVVPVEVPVTNTNPGPNGGDEIAIDDFCNRRGAESGIEQAASVDLGAFKISCGDLVDDASNDEDCIIIDWAGPGDFQGVMNNENDDGCEEFETLAENGTCEPTSVKERLRGLTAAVAAANLEGVDICTGFTCRDFDSTITITEIEVVSDSDSDFAEEDFATAAPEADPAAVAVRNASCREGADAAFEVVNFLYKEQSAVLLGRILEDTWFYLALPDNLGNCWVFGENLILDGPMEQLPYLIPPELPAPVNNGGSSDTTSPAEASNLSYVCTPGFFEFTLSWNDNSDNEDGFIIFKNGGQVGSVGKNVTNFVYNPGGSDLSTYIVEAYNGNGYSHTFIYDVACLP